MHTDVHALNEAYINIAHVSPNASANNSSRQVGNVPSGAASAVSWGEENSENPSQIITLLEQMLSQAKIGKKENYIRIYFDAKKLITLLDQAVAR